MDSPNGLKLDYAFTGSYVFDSKLEGNEKFNELFSLGEWLKKYSLFGFFKTLSGNDYWFAFNVINGFPNILHGYNSMSFTEDFIREEKLPLFCIEEADYGMWNIVYRDDKTVLKYKPLKNREAKDCIEKFIRENYINLISNIPLGFAFPKNALVFEKVPLKKTKIVLGKCPICGGDIVDNKYAYGCSNWKPEDGGCHYSVWKTIASRPISADEVETMFRNGQSDVLHGFINKHNKVFSARMVPSGNGIEFSFK